MDGHTYWRDDDGEWIGAPTYRDRSYYWPDGCYVRDFIMNTEDRAALEAWLTGLPETENPRRERS